MSKTPTITVNMDRLCGECRKPGTTDNGLCMGCTSKAMAGEVMNSETGNAVQRRVMEMKGNLAHDSKNSKPEGHSVAKSGFAKDVLKSFINRVERLNEERDALSADIREVFSEAKGSGFDVKILRQVIRLRRLDKADYQEQSAMLELYLESLDMK